MRIREENLDSINKHRYDGIAYIKLKGNRPIFTKDDKDKLERGESNFPDLDEFRHCGMAFARISKNTLSSKSDKRPKMHCKPSGFPASKEENTVNGKLIFQRCHLIGFRLFKIRGDKDENANLKKVFTGTRFMNNLMLYYENKIYEYVHETEKTVLYRVTPYFENNNKLVYGVQMEAMFINEMGNEDINLSFNVFVYNKQPYIEFNYRTGKGLSNKMCDMEYYYAIDEKKKKFHIKGCASDPDFDNDESEGFSGFSVEIRNKLIQDGYHSCAICDPM